MNRRSLILGLTTVLAAPAIVRAESLMKIASLRSSWGYTTNANANLLLDGVITYYSIPTLLYVRWNRAEDFTAWRTA